MEPQEVPADQDHFESRRNFLRRIGAGLMTAAIMATNPIGIFGRIGTAGAASSPWTKIAFAGRVGQTFKVNLGASGSVTLKLLGVKEGDAEILIAPRKLVRAKNGESFLLVFQGPHNNPLPQKMFRFEHNQLGKFSLFITPGTSKQNAQHYEAVINTVRV